jgi:hypothetical protein
MTVLGEAISNSWDANSKDVFIYIDRDKNFLVVKDNGYGMTADDFQDKFLRIGYSKRKDGSSDPISGRPFIGRKGIGKLALLSCAKKISVISRKKEEDYIGGVIDNSELDEAITQDLRPDEYPLEEVDKNLFEIYLRDHSMGTIIYFDGINDGIKNSIDFLRENIALYFRFSLIDPSFNIYLNGKPVTIDDLDKLAKETQFLWKINKIDDPYIKDKLGSVLESKELSIDSDVSGFIASVNKPRDLKVITAGEKVSVDLFVNGRLREKDILKHIPTARIVENYLYGQIHFNSLDDDSDRFTSSREGVVADDPKYKDILDKIRDEIIPVILEDWDDWRRIHKKPGDSENKKIAIKERKAEELFNVVSEEYVPADGSRCKDEVDSWIKDLLEDAKYNFSSYAECFVSENLLRKYINKKSLVLTPTSTREIADWRAREEIAKTEGNVLIDLRKDNDGLSYLEMALLARQVDDPATAGNSDSFTSDAKSYRPIRNAMMHTALLTDAAKKRLTTIYDNIQSKIRRLLSSC